MNIKIITLPIQSVINYMILAYFPKHMYKQYKLFFTQKLQQKISEK